MSEMEYLSHYTAEKIVSQLHHFHFFMVFTAPVGISKK